MLTQLPAVLAMSFMILAGVIGSAHAKPAETPTRVIVADTATIHHLNLYVAKELGLFRKHGVDVTIVDARDLPAARDLVVSGQADVFWSCPALAISSIATGAPLRFVAQVKTPCTSLLFLPKGSSVKSLRDLQGKRVAGISSTCEEVLAYRKKAREQGGEFVVATAAGGRALVDLEAGRLDGAILEEPYASIAELKGYKSAFGGQAVRMPCRAVIARTGFVRDNPAALKRLVEALREANALIAAKKANGQVVEIAAKYTSTPKKVLERSIGKFHFSEKIDEKGLNVLAEELVAVKAIRENPGERLYAVEMKGITWGK
jgi:NitT/TauT family transport system substrate-binding protein